MISRSEVGGRPGSRSLVRCLTLASLVAPASVLGVSAQDLSCRGRVGGDLGITGTGCRGDACVIARVPDGHGADGSDRFTWVYSVEPEVSGVRRGSPVDGVIRPGDRIVAIDGVPITTREGSRRFQHAEPGARVRLSYRRGSRVREVDVQAVARCEDEQAADELPGADAWPRLQGMSDRLAAAHDWLSWRDDALDSSGVRPDTASSPGDRPARADRAATATPAVGRPTTTATPGVHLGLTFECSRCAIYTNQDSFRWAFTQPPRVLGVAPGGPADRAGLRVGDVLSGIGGFDITSPRGGELFGNLRPGTPVDLHIIRPGGRLQEVTLVPEDPSSRTPPAEAGGVAPDSAAAGSLLIVRVLTERPVEVSAAPVHLNRLPDQAVATMHMGADPIRNLSRREN